MDPLERENSSTYLNRDTESQAPRPVQPTEPPKQKKSRAAAVLAILLLLVVAGAAVLGWLWYQQTGQVASLKSDLSKTRSEVTRLTSASHSDAQVKEPSKVNATLPTDSEAIVTAVSAYIHGQVGSANAKTAITVKALHAPFASAVTSDGMAGGFQCILKKADNTWIVLYCGNGDSEYTLQLDKLFGVPNSVK